MHEFSKKLQTEHVTLSKHSSCTAFKANVESILEYRHDKETDTRSYKPPRDNRVVCYIQDLHMAQVDKFGDQGALEAMRDYLTTQSWVSARKLKIRAIENVCFFADMATNHPETELVSGRLLHHFNLIVLSDFDQDSFQLKVQTMTDMIMASWSQSVHSYSPKLVGALIDISKGVFRDFRPTPLKSHYTFNWRDLTKIIFSLQMVESNSIRGQQQVMSLLYHECLRTFGDRILMSHDRKAFLQLLEQTCRKYFPITKKGPREPLPENPTQAEVAAYYAVDDTYPWESKDPDSIFFSRWNTHVEGCYLEI